MDACFTQKRMKESGGKGNPNRVEVQHPSTFFVDRAEVKEMEEYVESIRPAATSTSVVDNAQEGDQVIGNMKVPPSILHVCGESFKAADERRTKASTNFYSDTGLMAMHCRHDITLWVINMTSAGEKQYYALTVMRKLFSELPDHVRVGFMYDIGCQVHASCEKWDFLSEFRDRMEWAVSVFHAGGHEWACQLVYHPRKRRGFGRSDGEGCERFWSKLSRLIPNLRVQGYYSRLYTLDSQMDMLVGDSQAEYGSWIARKWKMAEGEFKKKDEEWQKILWLNNGWTEEMVLGQWNAQVANQTKPLQRQSRGLAKKIVLDIIALEERLEDTDEEIQVLEEEMKKDDEIDMEAAVAELASLHRQQQTLSLSLQKKKKSLSVDDRKDWERLKDNAFLAKRVNALAVKERLRNRLRMRRFELDALKRHESKHQKDTNRLTEHAKAHIWRREPTIKRLLKK